MSELCLKDERIAILKDVDGVPARIAKVIEHDKLPIPLLDSQDDTAFAEWMKRRCIPKDREGLEEMKAAFGTGWLANRNYASLSDQYWIRRREEPWKKVSFFLTSYSTAVGDMAFSPWTVDARKEYHISSPDLTTGGILRKRWLQGPDRCSSLVKAGSARTHQEPLSEVMVSVLAEQLGVIPCVKYDLWVEGTTMCSKCSCFVTQDTELVPAYQIYGRTPRADGESVYAHLLKACEREGIPGAEKFLEGMLFIDSLTGNEDRNLSNIGFIRDVGTMEFIGPAPLFDSGNAFWNTGNNAIIGRSAMFGDVEDGIAKKVMKGVDLTAVTSDWEYKKMIDDYPCLSSERKEWLIGAIGKRNKKFLKAKAITASR